MTITVLEAAALRAGGGIAQRADRPKQRRAGELPGSGFGVARRARVQIRAAADDQSAGLQFHGVASTTEDPYQMYDFFGPYNEVISAGAFAATLAQPGLDVPLVLGHDQMRRIARTTNGSLTLSEGETGLDVLADLDPTDPDVAYITPKLLSGLIDEMSFAFRITSGIWSPDYSEYRIESVDMQRGDVSIVGFGANPGTSGAIRSDELGRSARSLTDAQLLERSELICAELARRAPAPVGGMSFATAALYFDN